MIYSKSMPKKISRTKNQKSQLLPVLLFLLIVFSATAAWYATDPIWPLITLATAVLAIISLKKNW